MAPRRTTTTNNMQNLEARVNQLTEELRTLRSTRGQDEQLIEESRTVAETGGIVGYNSNRPLSEEEQAFHLLLTSMDSHMNSETADELFRQRGLTGYQLNKDADPKMVFIELKRLLL